MTDTRLETAIRELFARGYSLRDVRRFVFPELYDLEIGKVYVNLNKKRAEATRIILSTLGFSSFTEYELALASVRETQIESDYTEAAQRTDAARSDQIRALFEKGRTLRQIRQQVLPLDVAKMPKDLAIREIRIATILVLGALNLKSKEEFKKARERVLARMQHKRKRESGYFDIRPMVLERDGHKCVVTGTDKELQVHHIDGDETNNDLSNLLTVSKAVQTSLHHGTRALTSQDLEYWEKRAPSYAQMLHERFEHLHKYVAHIRGMGYPTACVECISGIHLFGPTQLHKKLHISSQNKNPSYSYWVAVLVPTGFDEEPKQFVVRQRPDWADYGFDDDLEDFDDSDTDDDLEETDDLDMNADEDGLD